MSDETIWKKLKSYNIPDTGVAAIMGNMYCESLCKANNVENRCLLSDEEYTALVDSDSGYDFVHDNGHAYGYGLCQWTYYTRKRDLLAFARKRGVSIGDEAMQIDFLMAELPQYARSYKAVQSGNMYDATDAFCKEFENPAVPNVQDRYNAAKRYYERFKGVSGNVTDTGNTTPIETENHALTLETVQTSNVYSDAVVLLQALLNKRHFACGSCDGFFGAKTQAAVNKAQRYFGITVDGICGSETWSKLLER